MDTTSQQKWEQCRSIIRNNITPEQYNALFAYTQFDSYANHRLVLKVPSQFIYDELESDDYALLISKTIHRVFGPDVALGYKIPVVKAPQGDIVVKSDQTPDVSRAKAGRPANESPDTLSAPAVNDLDSQLHRGYFFQNFYEDSSNILARRVGESVAEQPAKTFSPFFIFGHSGCGKTHLVNAIGWRLKELHPELRVLYLSAHLFATQFTDAVLKNKTTEFIAFYQTIDVLILDDVQELSGKLKTQNTFFHIFNHLHLNGKQIILTADRPPVKIEGLEDRLLTRLKWGMLAEIEKPTRELRYKILRGKVERDGLRISDQVLHYIADHIDDSVRDLEGIITSLLAYSVVYDSDDIDIALVNRLLPRFINVQKQEETTIEHVCQQVCDYFHISQQVIMSKSRKQEDVYARQVAMYLASRHTKQSTVQIGRAIGNRNHATVIHSIRQVKNLLETDERIRKDVDAIEGSL